MQIAKPGFYKNRDGKKVEILAIREMAAIGYDWEGDIFKWQANDGRFHEDHVSQSCLDIVSEWKEPEVFERWLLVGKNYGRISLQDAKNARDDTDAIGIVKYRIVDGKLESVEIVEE